MSTRPRLSAAWRTSTPEPIGDTGPSAWRGAAQARLQEAADTGHSPDSGPSAWRTAASRTPTPGPRTSVPRADTSESAQRRAAAYNKALRRELTQSEWAALSEPQQTQVRFNSELLRAYDADQTSGSTERANTSALFSNITSDIGTQTDIAAKLGLGVGPAVRYDELFGSSKPGSFRVKEGGGDATLSSMSEKIAAYLEELQGTGTDAVTVSTQSRAATLPSQYTFDNDLAREDYEVSFNAMLDPATLASTPWSQIKTSLVEAGYRPEDFQAYVLDRIKLQPLSAGMSTPADIQTWFK